MAEIILIAAADENNVIGCKGTIPWKLPEDLKRFKRLTSGHPCVMGRKTYESLPRRPLPGRENIVISANPAYSPEGATVKPSFEKAMEYCRKYPKVFLCGGSSVYRDGMTVAHTLELTRVYGTHQGDAFLPAVNPEEWEEVKSENHAEFSFQTYKRKAGPS